MMTFVAHAQLAFRLKPIEDRNNPATLHIIGFNNKGEVVGFVEDPRTRAFLWRDGKYIDLGNAIDPSAPATEAVGINDRSHIIGHRLTHTIIPFLLRNGRRIDIQPTPAALYGLNNRTQITGVSQSRSFVWERGRTTFLEDLPGTEFGSTPQSINDRGVIAGTSGSLAAHRAVIWKDGAIMALDLLPGAPRAQGHDINNAEQVVGVNIADNFRAFLWTDGTTTELPFIHPEQTISFASAINDWGTVVGFTATSAGSGFLATMWVAGKAIDLNGVIASDDPLKPFVHLDQALFINNRGQIVARGSGAGAGGAFLLTPTHRPPRDNHE